MTQASIRAGINLLLFLLLTLGARAARADLNSAGMAYKNEDYPLAFKEYRELAELGQPRAQFNLAIMYFKGQGVGLSNTLAHAWASLARANGEPHADELVAAVEPELTPTSLRLSAEIQAQFGANSLNARLMPQFLQGREYADREPVRTLHTYTPNYPGDASHRGIQGEVFIDFVVAADGHPRLPRVMYALPAGIFDAVVRDSVLRSSYLPARVNGVPVATTVSMFYSFRIPNLALGDYGDLDSRVKKTLAKAESGDTSAQLLYAMMIAGLPQLHQTYDKAVPWFLRAAQAGSPYAQYQLGTGLLRGRGCQCDEVKGEIWLQKAAQADESDAQVTLAEHLLRDHPTQESVAGALVWLERAAKQNNPSAKLYLAALLATSEDAGIHDPARALALADTLKKELTGDPTLLEIRAAAGAARGDYKDADRDQALAIKQATALGWDLTPMRKRQDMYTANQAWTGDLLAF